MAKFDNKFDDSDECRLFVTSDPHFNHGKSFILEPRGFKTVEEMNETIINDINKKCRPQDILLVLGDFCLKTKYNELQSLVGRINCEMWWLRGNHNNPWEKQYLLDCQETIDNSIYEGNNENRFLNRFSNQITGFELFPNVIILGDYLEFMWNGQMVVCNHYPFYVWNKQHHGAWSLCGHSHGTCKLSRHDDFTMKQLDCCWELHRKILSFEDLKKIMNKKQIKPVDHHNKHTT